MKYNNHNYTLKIFSCPCTKGLELKLLFPREVSKNKFIKESRHLAFNCEKCGKEKVSMKQVSDIVTGKTDYVSTLF